MEPNTDSVGRLDLFSATPQLGNLLSTRLSSLDTNQLAYLGLKRSFACKAGWIPSDAIVQEVMIYAGARPTIADVVISCNRLAQRFGVESSIERCVHMVNLAMNYLRIPYELRQKLTPHDSVRN